MGKQAGVIAETFFSSLLYKQGLDYKFIDESVMIARRKKGDKTYYINTYPHNVRPKAIKRVAEIYIVFENGVGDVIYTDDMVFIMNDDGKTCSTINVNLPA